MSRLVNPIGVRLIRPQDRLLFPDGGHYQTLLGAAVTDPSTPQTPRPRRNKGRDPQTIDLPATLVTDGSETAPEPEPVITPETTEIPSEPMMEDTIPAPETESAPARKSFKSGMILTGMICGLVGGGAGAAVVLALQKPVPTMAPAYDARIGALESRLKEPQATSPALIQRLGTMEAGQQALQNSLKAAGAKMEALEKSILAAQQDNTASTPEMDLRFKAVQDHQDALANSQRAMTGKIDALEKLAVANARQAVDPLPAVRYALIARLEQAVASGKPFGDALNAVLKSGVAESDVAALAPFTITGAPTSAQLKAEFKAPAEAIIAEDRSQSGETFTDKLTRMSKSVLRIRPSGDTQGSDTASLIVRIEAALDRGSFNDAQQIWNTMPDSARQLSAAWGKRIMERARAAAALQALNEKTVTALENSVR